jgi:DDE superfamily endonuclease
MEDILRLYKEPYRPEAPVVCFDERPTLLHTDARPPRPHGPGGKLAKRDYEYVRQGTANIFYAVEPKAGRHLVQATPNRKAPAVAAALKRVADAYPVADTIHLVMDNLSQHCEKTLVDHYGEEMGHTLWSRFTVHYTPVHGSWLSQAEVGLSLLSRQCLGTRRIGDLPTLRREVRSWGRDMNRQRLRFRWGFTPRKARKVFGYSRRDIRRSEH